jgi:hypothetical protein
MNVKCKMAQQENSRDGCLRLRVGGFDRRKVMFKGWVDVECFSSRGHEGSFCVMRRDVVRRRLLVWILLGLIFMINTGQPNIVATALESSDHVSHSRASCVSQVGLQSLKYRWNCWWITYITIC